MKLALCLFSLSVASVWAAEADDREAIGKVISALNEVPQRASLFAADADGFSSLDRLLRVPRRALSFRRDPPGPGDPPRVVISKEPWGEAILLPLAGTAELINPRISSGAIRFVTPDVALAEGICVYYEGSKTQTTPLLLVMKRDGDQWKIASVRVLAE